MVMKDCNRARPLKRVRRGTSSDRLDVLPFPVTPDDDDLLSSDEPFHKRVGAFLSSFGRASFPPAVLSSVVVWELMVKIGDLASVPIHVVEEDVTRATSVYCDQCRVVATGRSGHPVSRKRYLFILRAEDTNTVDKSKSCPRCGNPQHMADSRCKWCNIMITSEDLEEWARSQLEDNAHILHGVNPFKRLWPSAHPQRQGGWFKSARRPGYHEFLG